MSVMLKQLPTWLRAAVITGFQTFLGSFLVLLLSLVASVNEWIDGGVAPDWSVLAKALSALVLGFVTGVLTAAYRAVRPVENTYPEPPTTPNAGV
jgi:hypothetical protein